jgi:hypothetical protein
VLGDFEQVQHTEKTGFARELRSDVGKAVRLDRVDFNLAFFHAVARAHVDAWTHPDAVAAGDVTAADTVAKAFGEGHAEIALPQLEVISPASGNGGQVSSRKETRDEAEFSLHRPPPAREAGVLNN